jgi:phosphatidylglycerol lysyltransferase
LASLSIDCDCEERALIEQWPAAVQRARELVMQYGWNATSYQIVNPGIEHWFTASGDAVVGYVRHSGFRVVAGAPVCVANRVGDVANEFERDARSVGQSVCYFGAEERLELAVRDSPQHSLALLGAQPEWDLSEWMRTINSHSSLRAQFNRAINKGVAIDEWPPAKATGSSELKEILERWLHGRGLPPLHFLIEPATLERLDDRRVFVARRDHDVVAFAVLSPIPARNGWLVEQFPRAPTAPNGTIELLLRDAASAVTRDGAAYLTLGLAPLAMRDTMAETPEPAWLRAMLAWARAHGRRFYNFEGLERFKSKFNPHRWKPVYAIQNSDRFSPRALYAIAGAFASRSPVKLIGSALANAVAKELRSVRSSGAHKS